MTCADLEILICDYLDGTLGPDQKADVERHMARCAACAELAKDAGAAVAFLERVPAIEPPPELLTRILFERPHKKPAALGFLRNWLGNLAQPLLQPRFVMGAALTILSFSMLGKFAGLPDRQLRPADLDPVKIWAALDDRAHRTWERSVKFYESIRFVYEIQSRLREWRAQQDEQEREAANSELRDRQLKVKTTSEHAAPEETGAGAPQTGKSK
jgi:hypothetical protein